MADSKWLEGRQTVSIPQTLDNASASHEKIAVRDAHFESTSWGLQLECVTLVKCRILSTLRSFPDTLNGIQNTP